MLIERKLKVTDDNGCVYTDCFCGNFNDKAVCSHQTATVTLESNDFYVINTDAPYTTMIIVNDASKIPENAEIKSIELNAGTADAPIWIDLRDMFADYTNAPYFLNFNRFKSSNSYDGYLLGSICFPLQYKNDLITALDNYEIPQIRVTYHEVACTGA